MQVNKTENMDLDGAMHQFIITVNTMRPLQLDSLCEWNF